MGLSRQQLIDNLVALLTDNANKEITASKVREVVTNVINSTANLIDEVSFFGLLKHNPARSYKQGEGALIAGQLWESSVDQSAGALDLAKWIQITGLVSASDYAGSWDNLVAYAIDDLVERNNKLFKAVAASTGQDPVLDVNEDYWIEVSASAGDFGKAYIVNAYYKPGVVVDYNNRLYKLVSATDPYYSTNITTEITANDWLLYPNLNKTDIGLGNVINPNVEVLTTTDDTPTPFPNAYTVPLNKTVSFKAIVTGRRTNAPIGGIFHAEIIGSVSNVAGVLTLGNTSCIDHTLEDLGLTAIGVETFLPVDVSVSGTTLIFTFTGEIGFNMSLEIDTVYKLVG